MRKKDYLLIAGAISISAKFNFDTNQEPKKLFMVNNIADALAQADPKFNRNKFLEACGIEAVTTHGVWQFNHSTKGWSKTVQD